MVRKFQVTEAALDLVGLLFRGFICAGECEQLLEIEARVPQCSTTECWVDAATYDVGFQFLVNVLE